MDVYSENSYGVCVPVNSSANEVIIGMARASALQNSGASGKAVFSFLQTVERVCSSLHGSMQPHQITSGLHGTACSACMSHLFQPHGDMQAKRGVRRAWRVLTPDLYCRR